MFYGFRLDEDIIESEGIEDVDNMDDWILTKLGFDTNDFFGDDHKENLKKQKELLKGCGYMYISEEFCRDEEAGIYIIAWDLEQSYTGVTEVPIFFSEDLKTNLQSFCASVGIECKDPKLFLQCDMSC